MRSRQTCVVSVERDTFPAMLAAGAHVVGWVDVAYWLDLGTPEAFVLGSRDLVTGVVASSALPGPIGSSLVLAGAQVADGCELGGGTVVGRRAVVEAGARVLGSVLQDGAVVRAGAVVTDSVIGAGAVIGAGSTVHGAVVGDGATVGAECEIPAGVRVWVDAQLTDRSVRTSAPLD